jgi:methyl-accepting chemotaxis protein
VTPDRWRSADAAREITGLIGASVDKVEGGSRRVVDAGRTMQEFANPVQRVSDIISDISAAAAEQRPGIGRVNVNVTQLDQMTQQNAALVAALRPPRSASRSRRAGS